jgi:hypothetical protein
LVVLLLLVLENRVFIFIFYIEMWVGGEGWELGQWVLGIVT